MKSLLKICCAALALCTMPAAAKNAPASDPDAKALYELLDLDRPGLEKVRKAAAKGDYPTADKELLKYYRNRSGIVLAGLDLDKVTVKKDERQMADEALEHKFFAHKGYQPSYFYGDDIDWRYWPVKDNELRWQLHRHYWFIPLAKMYYTTGDEKYVEAWIDQYGDWIRKNPLDGVERLRAAGASKEEIDAERENIRFAWRPMEAGRRAQDLLTEFALTIRSPRFTPEFLNLFLRMYHQHAAYVDSHYSKQGNHLLFEAQRMVYAGVYFPEFRDAATWRSNGVEILNREIGVQVYPDGMQFELDFGYHIASIDIFLKALDMATANGMRDEFPEAFIRTVERMTEATWNLLFPDYSNPMFGDTKLHDKPSLVAQLKRWSRVFPDNATLRWFATEGREGTAPQYVSHALPDAGFYTLRTGWDGGATAAIVKAGPPAFWHNQPDNGTFEYWRRGRNFFPDSGSYVYGGDKEVLAQREWFRQTRVHNTLTLDDRNLETTDSKLLLWNPDGDVTVLVTENASYERLTHRRAMFLAQDGVLVIVDRASGTAAGRTGVHFTLCPRKADFADDGTVRTLFGDGNDIRLKTFCDASARIVPQEGWVSYAYRQKEERPAYSVEARKAADGDVLFITVVAPDDEAHAGSIAVVPDAASTADRFSAAVRIGGKNYTLKYEL